MTSEIARRINRLENRPGNSPGPYALLPHTCASTAEWFARQQPEQDGSGHYEPEPAPAKGFVRNLVWVPSHG